MIRKLLYKILINFSRIRRYIYIVLLKSSFKNIGKNVYIGKNCIFTSENISIGNDVYIGPNCCFQSKHGEIIIGSHVMFGPGVHIHGGDHITNQQGVYIKNVKKDKADLQVIIEDDVWIGAMTIILKGVKIGCGSIIGAGSIVTKDVPNYSIYYSKNTPIIRDRFSPNELQNHLNMLNKNE